MSVEGGSSFDNDGKAIVRRFYGEVHERGNVEVIDELFAPDCLGHSGGAQYANDWLKDSIVSFRAAFPGYRVAINHLIAEGDLTANRWTFQGAHSGTPYSGISPSSQEATLTGITIWRTAYGRVVEYWNAADVLSFLFQLSEGSR